MHVGGPTALALHGYAHYLPLGDQPVAYLYADAPPSWMKRLDLHTELRLRARKLFNDPGLCLDRTSPRIQGDSILTPWVRPMILATPERAILEALDELPDNEGFGTLDAAFESLTDLRPQLLTSLLASCRSVKVKRLFFVFADKHIHAWRKYIDAREFDLGSGDRAFTRGGRLHPTYRITVPEDLLAPANMRPYGT